jgi:hypothetical protein
MLAIALAGLAMAGPLARAVLQERRSVDRWIVIDDGATSAEIRPGGGTTLDAIKQGVLDSIRSHGPGDRVAVVLASTPPRVLVEVTAAGDAAAQAIRNLQTAEAPSDLARALEIAWPDQEIAAGGPRTVEVWSGFRGGSMRLDRPPPSSLRSHAHQVRLLATRPLPDDPANQSIASCRAIRTSGESEDAKQRRLRVQLKRQGPPTASSLQVLLQNDANETLARADARWNGDATEQEIDMSFEMDQRAAKGVRATIPADAQPLDNRRFISLDSTGAPQVAILGRKSLDQDIENLPASSWIARAIEATGMTVQESDAEALSIRPPLGVDTVILTRPDLVDQAGWNWLRTFTSAGGELIVTPATDAREQTWAVDLEQQLLVPIRARKETVAGDFRLAARQPRLGPLALLGAELDALAEPVHVARFMPLETTDAAAQTMIALADGRPLACWARPRQGGGVIAIFAAPPSLSWTDLPVKPLMVPLFQELVRGGRMIAAQQQEIECGTAPALGAAAAGGLLVPPPGRGAAAIELDSNGQSTRCVTTPGLWTLQRRDGRTQTVAVNLDASAASITPLSEAAVRSWFGAVTPVQFMDEAPPEVSSTSDSSNDAASAWMLMLALGCALLECVLARAGAPRASAAPAAGASS